MVVMAIVSTVTNLVVPGAGTALKVLVQIYELCQEVKEGQVACKRVHQRLHDILSELAKMETQGHLPSRDSLDKYIEMVRKCLAYLRKYTGKSLVSRVLHFQAMMDEIRILNEEIDTLMTVLNLATTGAMMQWKQEWEEERVAQTRLLSQLLEDTGAILDHVRSVREQQEVMLVLMKKLEQVGPSVTTHAPATKMLDTVMRATKSSVPVVPKWFIPRDDLAYDSKPFARGSCGALHRGTWGTGTRVVVKTLLMDGASDSGAISAPFLREIEVWQSLRHPHVVEMYGACHVTTPPFIVCADATNGNLAEYFSRKGRHCLWKLLYEAALGLEYLHMNRVVHGDLKLNNVLVGHDGKALVADFGLSVVCGSSIAGDGVDSASSEPTESGGVRWRAPECWTGPPTFASDVYSLAMCIIEAVTGAPPFGYVDDATVMSQVRNGLLPPKPEACPIEAWELVVSMATRDTQQRRPLKEVIETLKSLMDKYDTVPPPNVTAATAAATEESGELSSVAELVEVLKSSESFESTYAALKWLSRKAETTAGAIAIKNADGYRWIVNCAMASDATWGHWAYASACICCMHANDAITLAQQIAVATRDPSQGEINQLHEVLKSAATHSEELVIEALEKVRVIEHWPTGSAIPFAVVIVDILRRATTRVLEEATGTILCIVDLEKEFALEVIKLGVAPLLLNQLDIGSERVKKLSATTLAHLAVHDSRAVPPPVLQFIMHKLRTGDEREKANAAQSIGLMAQNKLNDRSLEEHRVFEPLVELIRSGSEQQKAAAAWSLSRLSMDEATCEGIALAGDVIPSLIELLRLDTAVRTRLVAMDAMVCLASKSEACAHEIIRSGGIQAHVEVLRSRDIELKEPALRVLGNLVSFLSIEQAVSEAAHIVGPVVECLRLGDAEQKEMASILLHNLLVHWDETICQSIVAAGALAPLVDLLGEGTDQAKECAAMTLGALARVHSLVCSIVDAGAVTAFVELTKSNDDTLKAMGNQALHHIGHATNVDSNDTVNVAEMVERARSRDAKERSAAIYVLGMHAQTCGSNADAIVAAGGIAVLVAALHSGTENDKEMALVALRHATASYRYETHQVVVQTGIVPRLVEFVRDGDDKSVQAAFILTNLAVVYDHSNGKVVSKAGGVAAIAALLQNGSVTRTASAAYLIGTLARKSEANRSELARLQIVSPLVEMVRSGTEVQKEDAAFALGSLMKTAVVRREVKQMGGLDTLKTLAKNGQASQVDVARRALRIGSNECRIS